MNLQDFMVFGDESPAPSKPKASLTKPKPKKSVPTPTPKEKDPLDNFETEDHLKKFFEDHKIIGKKDLINYSERKTILGNKIKASDRIIEVTVINANGADTNKFISISPKIMAEREIRDVAYEYVAILVTNRRTPYIVDRQYMEKPEYTDCRDKVYDQFT